MGRRGAVIDIYGDAVVNCNDLTGDTWRHRHDTIKPTIVTECLQSKLAHDCEVYGMFSDPPAAAEAEGGGLEWGRV